MKILIINGVNLNMLGTREKEIYGTTSYDEMCRYIDKYYHVDFFQSNSESKIVDQIHKCHIDGVYDGIVINPGAYSHYSIAILDALYILNIPIIEVHISDVMNREEFRRTLITAKACKEVISGYGIDGYIEAIKILREKYEISDNCSNE